MVGHWFGPTKGKHIQNSCAAFGRRYIEAIEEAFLNFSIAVVVFK